MLLMPWSILTSTQPHFPHAPERFHGSKTLMNSTGGLLEGAKQRYRQLQPVEQLVAAQTANGPEPVAKATVVHGMLHQFQHPENEGTATALHRVTKLAAPRREDLLGKTTEGHIRVTKGGRRIIRHHDARHRMRTRTYRAMMATGVTTVGQMTEIHLRGEMIGARVTIVDIGIGTMNTRTETGRPKIVAAQETEEREVAAAARGGMSTSGIIEFENASTRTTGDDYTDVTAAFSRNPSESTWGLWRILNWRFM